MSRIVTGGRAGSDFSDVRPTVCVREALHVPVTLPEMPHLDTSVFPLANESHRGSLRSISRTERRLVQWLAHRTELGEVEDAGAVIFVCQHGVDFAIELEGRLLRAWHRYS